MSAFTEASVRFEFVSGMSYRQIGQTAWELGYKGSTHWERVETGTVFDVSVPLLLRWLVDPHDPRYFKAAALHDELLTRGFDRVTAAGAFNQALLADGVGRWERLRMVGAVALYKFA